ncbi:hypothetical protein [Roseibium sp. Sym1]|uniref:hypothetical protein n=1 Tax=Roseibium sp. Sym1 TaxID=3016006 RepID=UPI0022B59CF7|nr:hypothetical protein [Roseibium sp. Sym1]
MAGTALAYCPGPVAIVEDLALNAVVVPQVERLYRKLGCELTTAPYPGRRGVVAFNAHDVSGELFRLRLVEDSYETGFVRSAQPVLQAREAIWIQGSGTLSATSKIGYVIGRWWQEEYAQANADQFNFVKYSSSADLWMDYERHLLDGFLASDILVETELGKGDISEKPAMARLIRTSELYHYLGTEFSAFMADFSELLRQQSRAQ